MKQEHPPDMVNHPPHYNDHPSGVECIDIVEHYNFNIGNAMKYLWRAGLKGDEQSDILKAQWYINREIGRRQKFAVRTDSPSGDATSDQPVQVPPGSSPFAAERPDVPRSLPAPDGPPNPRQRGSRGRTDQGPGDLM